MPGWATRVNRRRESHTSASPTRTSIQVGRTGRSSQLTHARSHEISGALQVGDQTMARYVWLWNPYLNRMTRPTDAVESPARHYSSDTDDSSQSHKPHKKCTRNCRSRPGRRQTTTSHTARRLSSSRAWRQDSFDHNWSMNRWSSSKSQHSRSFSSCTRYRRTL